MTFYEGVEVAEYNYRIRTTKYGPSLTKFLDSSNNTKNKNNNSHSNNDKTQCQQQQQSEQQQKQQQQPLNTAGSLGRLETTLSHKMRLILELKQIANRMSAILQEFETQRLDEVDKKQ